MMLRKTALAGALALMAACGGSGSSSGGGSAGSGAALADEPQVLSQRSNAVDGQLSAAGDDSFADLLNGFRTDEGRAFVSYDARLDAAAQGHAEDMRKNGYFSHTSQDGRSVEDRIRAQGYNPVAWGENIARGQDNEAAALAAWIDSPAHLRLLRAETVEDFGLAMSGSGSQRYWVLVMASER